MIMKKKPTKTTFGAIPNGAVFGMDGGAHIFCKLDGMACDLGQCGGRPSKVRWSDSTPIETFEWKPEE